jgi:uncharacterized protein DUF4241
MAYAPDLDQMLDPGPRYVDEQAHYVIERHLIGEVTLPTGQVAGCDPLAYAGDALPFTVPVSPGRYQLAAWVAALYHAGSEWERRVAALQLIIRDEPVTRWQLALAEGQGPAALGQDEYFGYPVDAGTGTLADLAAVQAMATWDYQRLEDVFIPDQVPDTPVPGLVAAVTDDPSGANVIIVTSGWGDGTYPTFTGYTADGRISSFVTDFQVDPAGCQPFS